MNMVEQNHRETEAAGEQERESLPAAELLTGKSLSEQTLSERIREHRIRIAVIGLGYVGLPLAVEFGRKYDTVGFDLKEERLSRLREGEDTTLEVPQEDLKKAVRLRFSGREEDLRGCDFYIVTVPTPVDCYNRPDLGPLLLASETVGKVLKRGSVVVYESTVYPGCTEEECVPVLERNSSLRFNRDFFCAYSPERINPGDRKHRLTKILKITSGSTPETADAVDLLYNSILEAGTYRASCIKVAEAAKVIENSQRDLNVAFVNELAKIFHLIGIDTHEVLEAAGTKWNFLHFTPGLVGGHCIGVDPYYLTHKAQALGYLPEVILAGRRMNDGMGRYVVYEVVRLMIKKGIRVLGSRVLQLGITFKENCPDIRNSKAADVVRGLREFGCEVDVRDPWASPEELERVNGFSCSGDLSALRYEDYSAVILAVAHDCFRELDYSRFPKDRCVLFDIKGILPKNFVDGRL